MTLHPAEPEATEERNEAAGEVCEEQTTTTATFPPGQDPSTATTFMPPTSPAEQNPPVSTTGVPPNLGATLNLGLSPTFRAEPGSLLAAQGVHNRVAQGLP